MTDVHMKGRTRDGWQGKPHLLTIELDPQVLITIILQLASEGFY